MGNWLSSFTTRHDFTGGVSRVQRLWKPMAGWTLLVWLTGLILLAPLTSALIAWKLRWADQPVIGNEDLVAWFLTLDGLIYIILLGSMGLVGLVIRYAGYFQIISDDLHGHPIVLRRIFLGVMIRLPILFRFSLFSVGMGWLLLLPLGGLLYFVYQTFLGDHDPNYYLYTKPPEWYRALSFAGASVVAWVACGAYLAGRILLALPYTLDENVPYWKALRKSWHATRGRSRHLLKSLLLLVVLWLLLRLAADSSLYALGAVTLQMVAAFSPYLWPILLATALFLVITLMIDLTLSFLGFSVVATMVTTFYYEESEIHHPHPPQKVHLTVGPLLRLIRPWLHPVRLLPMMLLLAAGSLYFSSGFFDEEKQTPSVLISAHRGGPPPAPENTLAALELAIEAGADFSEIDVMRTRDGVVVLAHDADLMRMAGDPRRIADHPYEALKEVVQIPASGFPEAERHLATLSEVMERARGRIGLMIELKYYGPDPQLAPEVVRLIQAHEMEAEVVVMSLNLEAVRKVKALAPELTTGYVSTFSVGQMRQLPFGFLALPRGRITSQTMRESRRQGIAVHAWTINRVDRMADMMELGVVGLITDDPATAVRVRDETAAMSPLERFLLRFHRLVLDD